MFRTILWLTAIWCAAILFLSVNAVITVQTVGELNLQRMIWVQAHHPILWIVDGITLFLIMYVAWHFFSNSSHLIDLSDQRSALIPFQVTGLIWGVLIYTLCTLVIIQYDHQRITGELILKYWSTHPLFLGLLVLIPLFFYVGHLIGRFLFLKEQNIQFRYQRDLENQWVTQQMDLFKKREVELKEAREDAIRGVKAKDQFLSNMSHEIRTPMSGIIGIINLLKDSSLNPEQKKYIEAIDYSSQNLLILINQILDLSKINSERLTLEYVDFDLYQNIKSIENTFQGLVMEKGLVLRTAIDASVPKMVNGDPIRLNQILLNLVGNAIKFTKDGGVDLIVKSITNDDGPRLRLQINDTGIGIGEDKLRSIFEPFSQAGSDTTRLYGGTGLGLTISKQLVELYGGTIQVQSQLGKGTCFEFEIQLKPAQEKRAANKEVKRRKVTSSGKSNQLKVLVAEDNKANQLVVKHTLKKYGFDCEIVSNGQEVINKVYEEHFDVILMDIQMPVMGGIDATRFIRNGTDSPLKDIKILAMTASLMEEDIASFKNAGMDDFVPKPFKAQELVDKIYEHTNVAA